MSIGHPNANPFPVHGPLWLDASAFGMSTGIADNTPALQAACDAAKAAVDATIGGDASRIPLATVFIPGSRGTYQFKNPVFIDGSCIRLLGEGRGALQGTKLAKVAGFGSPMFVVGLSRTYGGVVPNATYRPDLWNGGSPKLDNTVVTGANQLWGIRTNSDLIVESFGSSFTHGGFSIANRSSADYWQECDYLTVEAIVEGFTAGQMPIAYIGCGNGPQSPVPFILSSVGSGNYSVAVGYQTSKWSAVTATTYSFSAGAATGVIRITFQVDLINRAVQAFVNGVQVTVTGTAPPANARFPEPGTAPGDNIHGFFVNASYNSSVPGNADFALYGLSVSKTLKYANKGVGQPQTPNPQIAFNTLTIPGTPTGGTFTLTYKGQTTSAIAFNASAATIQSALGALSTIGVGNVAVSGSAFQFSVIGSNGVDFNTNIPSACNGASLTGSTVADAYRCFAVAVGHGTPTQIDNYDIAHFIFNENPSTNTRHLSIFGNQSVGGRSSSAFLLNGQTLNAISSQIFFEGLEIDADQGYGIGILRAHVLEQHYDDCRISGGLWGVADAVFGANYTNYFHNCVITGFDAGVNLYYSLGLMDTVTFTNNGRWTYRLTGCNMDARNIFVTSTGNPQYGFVRICNQIYGGTYVFNNVTIDNEGVNYGLAAFYAERHPYTGVQLTVVNSYLGLPGTCEMFMLKDIGTPPIFQSAILTVDFIAADVMGNLVNVDGPGWQFRVTNTGIDGGSDVYNIGTFPGNPRGRVEYSMKLPMRYGQSWPGCSVITNAGATDGQFATIMPASSGNWGSTIPAAWKGSTPLVKDDTATLASYMQDHTSYGVTLSGRASSFGYTTNQVAAPVMANTMFGGSIAGISTVLSIGGAGVGGTFTLTYGGNTTSAITYSGALTAATIQTALQGLASVGAGNMVVSGPAGGPWTITLAGSLARTAGGILGLTVNGAGLTATGASASVTNGVVSFGGVLTGGTYTITYNGATTSGIPYNASASTVANAIIALNSGFSQYAAIQGASGGPFISNLGIQSVNPAGLTVSGGTATLTSSDIPKTWYIGLLKSNARKRNYPITETYTSFEGFTRQPIVNSSSGFAAASAGAKANAAGITFPACTLACQIASVALCDAPVGGNIWAVMQLSTPLSVAAGDILTIPIGALTLANIPAQGMFGTMTNYAWGKLYDMIFGAASFVPPATWYAGLSTVALGKTSTTPTEPGNGYTRVAVANDSSHWKIAPDYGQLGDVQNVLPITFPTPTGSQGTIVAAALSDSSGTGTGNAWLVAPTTTAVTPSANAPTIAPGSLSIGLG